MLTLKSWYALMEESGSQFIRPSFGWYLIRDHYHQRSFHSWSHIEHGWLHLEDPAVLALAKQPIVLKLGWLMHDAVTPWMPGHEAHCADAAKRLYGHHLHLWEVVPLIGSYITATDHNHLASYIDHQLIADIDLTELAVSPEQFEQNTALINQEQPDFAPEQLAERHKDFARMMLGKRRPHIFQTPYFRQRFEAQARANLERLLATPPI